MENVSKNNNTHLELTDTSSMGGGSSLTRTLSIVIAEHNAKDYVERCVKSIIDSGFADYEIIVSDDGSSDGTPDYLQEKFAYLKSRFSIVRLSVNGGPAKARNEGVKVSRGKYLCFLDSDTVVDKNWADVAIKAFEADAKLGAIQCKLLLMKERDKIDYVGEFIGQNGFLVQRAKTGEIDRGQYDQRVEILAAKSAGMFIRRESFDAAGGFDPDYFIYVEETDLGWRVWLAGYKVVFIPESIVYHEFGTSSVIFGKSVSSYRTKFHGSKNYIRTLIKNLGVGGLLTMLPVHIMLWVGLAVYQALKGQVKEASWIFSGILWNASHLGDTLSKRKSIQSIRKVSDKDLFSKVMVKKPFTYFLRKAVVKHKAGNAESF